MLGGGKHIVNFGLSLVGSATNSASASQRAYQPASTACGSNALGISLCVVDTCFIALSGEGTPARWSRLARASRRRYGYVLFAAHDFRNSTVCRVGARRDPRWTAWRPSTEQWSRTLPASRPAA